MLYSVRIPNTDETSVLSVLAGVDIQALTTVLHRHCLQWYRKHILSRFVKHYVCPIYIHILSSLNMFYKVASETIYEKKEGWGR